MRVHVHQKRQAEKANGNVGALAGHMLDGSGRSRECAPHGHVVHGAHGGLVHTEPQAALSRREYRRHNLLRFDHVTKEREVVHPPREAPAGARI